MILEHDQLAAIDLGSNSFHMIVARRMGDTFQVIDRLREPVRLANGLDGSGNLTEDTQQRALACLRRFGQRLTALSSDAIRAVGTNTLRCANNAEEFLTKAERALGTAVQIIAGVEEARLIYLGVTQTLASSERRLVIDIGGGSTELIIGQGLNPIRMESLHMGCVTMTNRFFGDGRISEKAFELARLAAHMELEPKITDYRRLGWQDATGASGTIRAIVKVTTACGWGGNGITLTQLQNMRQAILSSRSIDELQLPGLSDDRRPVFVGGVVVLLAAFEALGIEHMDVSEGALREGLLSDLIGRMNHDDVRDHSTQAMSVRYHADQEQIQRVEETALHLLGQVATHWQLSIEQHGSWLKWAATLHEIGLDIAHSQFHKHGAYIVENADLAGFTRQEQRILASIIIGHRRRFSQKPYRSLPPPWNSIAQKLTQLLRIAVLLHRSRRAEALPDIRLSVSKDVLQLRFPAGWLELNPLTTADLEQENTWLSEAKIHLHYC